MNLSSDGPYLQPRAGLKIKANGPTDKAANGRPSPRRTPQLKPAPLAGAGDAVDRPLRRRTESPSEDDKVIIFRKFLLLFWLGVVGGHGRRRQTAGPRGWSGDACRVLPGKVEKKENLYSPKGENSKQTDNGMDRRLARPPGPVEKGGKTRPRRTTTPRSSKSPFSMGVCFQEFFPHKPVEPGRPSCSEDR